MQVIIEVIGMGAKKYGGFERYILEEAKQLKRRKCKLVVVFDSKPLVEQYLADLVEYGVDVYIISYSAKIKFIISFCKLIVKYRPLVVHTNFSSNIFISQIIACFFRVPIRISTEHCLPKLDLFRLRFFYNFLSVIVSNILPVSYQSSLAIKKRLWFNKDKIQYLYLGVVDFEHDKIAMRSKYHLPLDKTLFMNIAYHNPIKGVDILLKGFSLFLKRYNVRDVYLCQIGGGQTGQDTLFLKNLANTLGISDRVIWMGVRNNVPEILSAGDIYFQTSRSEGIGLSIMEASLAKLPVVGTNVGGIPEVAVQDLNSILVENEDINGIAEAMFFFYSNPSLRIKMGLQGREYALQKFCLASQVDKLLMYYYKLK